MDERWVVIRTETFGYKGAVARDAAIATVAGVLGNTYLGHSRQHRVVITIEGVASEDNPTLHSPAPQGQQHMGEGDQQGLGGTPVAVVRGGGDGYSNSNIRPLRGRAFNLAMYGGGVVASERSREREGTGDDGGVRGMSMDEAQKILQPAIDTQLFQCPSCGVNRKTTHDLASHLLTHTDHRRDQVESPEYTITDLELQMAIYNYLSLKGTTLWSTFAIQNPATRKEAAKWLYQQIRGVLEVAGYAGMGDDEDG